MLSIRNFTIDMKKEENTYRERERERRCYCNPLNK